MDYTNCHRRHRHDRCECSFLAATQKVRHDAVMTVKTADMNDLRINRNRNDTQKLCM